MQLNRECPNCGKLLEHHREDIVTFSATSNTRLYIHKACVEDYIAWVGRTITGIDDFTAALLDKGEHEDES